MKAESKSAKRGDESTTRLLQDLVSRAQLASVEVSRLAVERRFAGSEQISTPMPPALDIKTSVELFSPTTKQTTVAAFLVSLRTRWLAEEAKEKEVANAWVALRMGYTFAGQEAELTPTTLRAFGEAVVRPQAWPFLRERIFTMSQLAGLPPPILPLLALNVPPPQR